MKNILSYFHLDFESSFSTLKTRFLLSTIIILILTGALLYFVNAETESIQVTKFILTAIVVFFFSTGMRLFLETSKEDKKNSYLEILPILYGIVFYITIEPVGDWGLESVVYFILHLTGFLSFIFFSPYLKELFYGELSTTEYANYFSRTAGVFLMSMIVGGSLLALGFIAIGSVISLFDLNTLVQEDKIYRNWAVIALAFIAPLYGLTQIPDTRAIKKTAFEMNKFFSFLIRFVAVPFIYVYFFILYTYSAKVLLNFSDWPKGMITWMVIGFSTFGYLTYIFSLAYENENRLVSIFRRYFPYLVIPQIIMLAYAISLRITQYDLTMNRYFVVVFGLWLLGISVYLIISKRKSLVSITASLALISMLISVGPWSVYSLPLERQYKRLVQNLGTTGLLVDGKLQTGVVLHDTTMQNDIYSGIEYVCGLDECSKIKILFPNEYQKAEVEGKKNWDAYTYEGKPEYPGASRWEIVSAVTSALGISYSYNGEIGAEDAYTTYNTNAEIYPMDVGGYEELLSVYESGAYMNTTLSEYVVIYPESERANLVMSGSTISLSLSEFNKNLRDKYGTTDKVNLSKDELSAILTGSGYEVKLMFQSYALRNPDATASGAKSDYSKPYSIYGFALVKKLK